MRTSTFFVPLAVAFAANALDINIGPHTVCGDDAIDCNNGFCCSAGDTCDTSGTVTKCGSDGSLAKAFSVDGLQSAIGDKVETLKDQASSLAGQFESVFDAFPTELANSAKGALSSFAANHEIPTGTALDNFIDSLPTSAQGMASSVLNSLETEINGVLGGSATGADSNGQPQNTEDDSGAAPAGSATFGNTAALMVGIWGAAAVGGAMLVL